MDTVTLEGLEFFAFHGYYDEEQKIGNKYGVDITVHTALERASEKDSLADTINYEDLYAIIRHEMKIPSRLLENIGFRIIKAVFGHFPAVETIEVSIFKFNPPIKGICRAAKVTLIRHRP